MQSDKHKRNKEFTNIYCNYNKHLNYEAFYYMCENNRIFFTRQKLVSQLHQQIDKSLFYIYLQKMDTYNYNC